MPFAFHIGEALLLAIMVALTARDRNWDAVGGWLTAFLFALANMLQHLRAV